jgi:hypothetical protein
VRQVFAVFAALIVMAGSSLGASAQENVVPVTAAQVGGHYTSTIGRFNSHTFRTSTGMGVEVWKFDAAFGQCVDMTVRSTRLAPALMLFDDPGLAPAIMQDQGRGSWAEIRVMMPKSGTYYLATIAASHDHPRSAIGNLPDHLDRKGYRLSR